MNTRICDVIHAHRKSAVRRIIGEGRGRKYENTNTSETRVADVGTGESILCFESKNGSPQQKSPLYPTQGYFVLRFRQTGRRNRGLSASIWASSLPEPEIMVIVVHMYVCVRVCMYVYHVRRICVTRGHHCSNN